MRKFYWKHGEPKEYHNADEAIEIFLNDFIPSTQRAESTEKAWCLFLDEFDEWVCIAGSMQEEFQAKILEPGQQRQMVYRLAMETDAIPERYEI